MKMMLGKILNHIEAPVFVLDIPGIGITKFKEPLDDFPYVELNKEQLLNLKKEINRSLRNG